MKTIVNFSHPLAARALAQVEAAAGEAVEEILFPCQIDMERPVKPQLDALVEQVAGVRIDYYVPPALSFAAAYVTAKLSYAISDAMRPEPPAMIVLRREGTPPQFVLAEIV